MKFSRLISTIFLATIFACILLFACIFWFYSNADSKTLGLLKDSLSTASSFFGGITTLTAAYIASRLFNDWKIQHNKNLEKEAIFKTLSIIESNHFPLKKLVNEMLEVRHGLSKGFTKFQNNMAFVKDPEFKERLRYSTKLIESFSGDLQVSNLLEKYFEELTLLENQTTFYINIHNDVKKSIGLGEYDAPLIVGVDQNMSMLIPDDRSPVPYERKSENYNHVFNELTAHLISRTRA